MPNKRYQTQEYILQDSIYMKYKYRQKLIYTVRRLDSNNPQEQ